MTLWPMPPFQNAIYRSLLSCRSVERSRDVEVISTFVVEHLFTEGVDYVASLAVVYSTVIRTPHARTDLCAIHQNVACHRVAVHNARAQNRRTKEMAAKKR